ncbi:hypothetical protein STENM223S_03260 [Streptomyces tendae]
MEQADRLFPARRGKGLQPRTMEVFDDLGVLDAIHAAGGTYPVGMIWQNGERAGGHRMFDPAEATDDSPYNAPWMVPQWRTQEVLLARLEELGGRVAFGRELVGPRPGRRRRDRASRRAPTSAPATSSPPTAAARPCAGPSASA